MPRTGDAASRPEAVSAITAAGLSLGDREIGQSGCVRAASVLVMALALGACGRDGDAKPAAPPLTLETQVCDPSLTDITFVIDGAQPPDYVVVLQGSDEEFAQLSQVLPEVEGEDIFLYSATYDAGSHRIYVTSNGRSDEQRRQVVERVEATIAASGLDAEVRRCSPD